MQDKQRERAHLVQSDRHLGSTSHDRDSLLNVWPRAVTTLGMLTASCLR
jgi:hypothetical protein